MKQAKFNLRAWVSNSNRVQALATKNGVADKDTTVNLTGGNIFSDTITFAPKAITPDDGSTITK